MKNQWIEFLNGMVTVKVTGRGTERFLNILTRNGLYIWNVKRHGTETITFQIRLQDALTIRRFARQSQCRISFLRRKGLPFLFKRIIKNAGFLTGAAVFFIMVFLLSNVIWGIDIRGAKPATEHQIRKELDKMGVKIGRFQFFVDNVETIQRKITNSVGAVTWVGVELKGTTYHLQVVEKNEPKKPEPLAPQNLVATKKATIYKMEVNSGQKVVDVHDQVVPGQILVSGEIGQEGQTILVPAEGKIWGETWYTSHVELPMKTDFKVFSGKAEQKYGIILGNWEIPVWGFGKPEFKEYETEKNVHTIHFLKWDLPAAFDQKILREREDITRVYTEKEAEQIALDMAKTEIKKRLNEDAIIKDEKILHKAVENGKVILDIHFKIIENIAAGQPIFKETHE